MATIQINVIYNSEKETLNQALASLLTAKPDTTETPVNVQMSLFDNKDLPQGDPCMAASAETTEASVQSAESQSPAPEPQLDTQTDVLPDTQPEPKKISKADVRALTIELSKKNKTALKSIFKDLGASCFSEVKEENYPEFHKKLSAALNKSKEAANG